MTTAQEQQAESWARHRRLLFTVAYEMLGSAADAEDVLQEVWLRWADVPASEVRDPRAYLVRITTRLALNRLRTLSRRREEYVGPWLPEPVLTGGGDPVSGDLGTGDPADAVALADSVSTAMLLVLETLKPVERTVFVLREVFGLPYAEIAAVVDRSEPAVRQVGARARARVAARRPAREVESQELALVVDRFLGAAAGGDLSGLVDALAPDVVLVSDGGGRVSAALRPIHGADKVLRFLAGVQPADAVLEVHPVNGSTGLVVLVDGRVDSVVTADLTDGLVSSIYVVRNPDKLARFAARLGAEA